MRFWVFIWGRGGLICIMHWSMNLAVWKIWRFELGVKLCTNIYYLIERNVASIRRQVVLLKDCTRHTYLKIKDVDQQTIRWSKDHQKGQWGNLKNISIETITLFENLVKDKDILIIYLLVTTYCSIEIKCCTYGKIAWDDF